jgi:thymidylate kinase
MLIEIAGIDGCGKSTVIAGLRARLTAHGHDCTELVLRSTSKRVLDDVARDAGARTWREVFTAQEVETAHAVEMLGQVNTVVTPLAEGRILLTDTYVARWLATAARYECTDLGRLARIYAKFPAPSIAFLLDLPTQDAFRRLSARRRGDRLMADAPAALPALDRYAAAFRQTSELLPYSQYGMDATRPAHEILGQIIDRIRSVGLTVHGWPVG